jgi:ubiquinone/menaquinone biosynthesis C-methylase UbiE
MTQADRGARVDRLAAESLANDDATGWFEKVYAAGEEAVPWATGGPDPLLVDWAGAQDRTGKGERAVVVGCGLGDDAEFIAGLGWRVVAFDVAPTAIAAARSRFPSSSVEYTVADLFALPEQWPGAFELVVENFTVQALPLRLRRQAITEVARLVAPGGTLIVQAHARAERDSEPDGPPWPLSRAEMASFATGGLVEVLIEDVRKPGRPDVPRWRAEFHRPVPHRAGPR